MASDGARDGTSRRAFGPAVPQSVRAGSGPAPVEAAAKRQGSDELEILPVYTAEQLQQAVSGGAAHIEIRAHLDLLPLQLQPAPADVLAEYTHASLPANMALLAAPRVLKSVRGNCSIGQPADGRAWPGLQAEDTAGLLPLKPWQCLLVIDKTWLMLTGSPNVWVDNLYLKLQRDTVNPATTFITSGARGADGKNIVLLPMAADKGRLYVTNVTFQGDASGAHQLRSATGIYTEQQQTDLLLEDCVFTDWAGSRSPLTINGLSVASVRSTLFRNMHLAVELADVSFGGTVYFQDASLAGVTLGRDAVVGTTNNDDNTSAGCSLYYEAEDDAEYDVGVQALPERGAFGQDSTISNGAMSDCLFLRAPRDAVLPGCPPQSVAKRQRMRDGYSEHMNANTSSGAYDSTRILRALHRDRGGGTFRAGAMAAMMQELPARPPPPQDWPPFVLPPPPAPVPTASPDLAPAICSGTSCTVAMPPPPGAAAPTGPASRGADGVAAAALGLAALFAVCLAVVLWMIRATWGHSRCNDTVLAAGSTPRWHGESCEGYQLKAGWAPKQATTATRLVAATVPRRSSAVPRSALNRDYEYMLPHHLALLAAPHTVHTTRDHTATSPSAQPDAIWSVSGPPTRSLGSSGRGDTAGGGRHSCVESNELPTQERAKGLDCTKSMRRSGGAGAVLLAQPASRCTTMDEMAARREVMTDGAVHASTCNFDDERGGTVVLAPYTVSTCSVSAAISCGEIAVQSRSTEQHGRGVTHCTGEMKGSGDGMRPSASVHHSGGDVSYCHGTAEHASRDMYGRPEPNQTSKMPEGVPMATCRHFSGACVQDKATSNAARLQRLQRQLDRFGEGDAFLGRFTMRGRQHRRHGGQAVVQFADGCGDGCEYAVKFFLSAADFHAEAALYAACQPFLFRSPPAAPDAARRALLAAHEPPCASDAEAGLAERRRLGDAAARFLPQVEAVCEKPRDPAGRLLPPCIVMEKGESLQDWSNRAEPDLFMAVAVLSHVSKCLADMHDAGFVHRDLKPANVMWLLRENRWTVIDFGCVAHIGESAPLSFTLAYAAPEAVHALTAGRKAIVAAAALDAWSLGVMAFELLTGEPAFQLLTHGCEQVVRMLTGAVPLPWEGGLSAQHAHRLGAFKGVVLQLLRREPGERLGLRPFHAACTELFATHSTITA